MIEDYFVAAIPAGVDLDDVERFAALRADLERQVHLVVMGQYKRPPRAILLAPIEWLITDSPDEVEAFQPDHDCDECRAGNARAREYLDANPGQWVACANLQYSEVWT